MFDVSKVMAAKLWWKFRTGRSLWTDFMWNKYCKKITPTLVKWKGGSHLRKKMLENRSVLENVIWWEPKSGTANIWFDNWTQLGPIFLQVLEGISIDETSENVAELMQGEQWNYSKMQLLFPEYVVKQVEEKIGNLMRTEHIDRPWWMLTGAGKFIISSAWNLLRSRDNLLPHYDKIWVKGLPFKISFFLWRLGKAKIPIDEVLTRMGISLVSRCVCCSSPKQETMEHMFLEGEMATRV